MLRWRTALQCFCSGSGIAGPDYGSGIRSHDTGEVLPLFLFPNLANRLFDRAKHIEFRVIHPVQKTLNRCGLSSCAEHKVGASRALRLIFLDANQRPVVRMCRIRNKIGANSIVFLVMVFVFLVLFVRWSLLAAMRQSSSEIPVCSKGSVLSPCRH